MSHARQYHAEKNARISIARAARAAIPTRGGWRAPAWPSRRRRVALSVGPDLPYFTGYEAMPLERLTMLVLPQTGDPVLLVPRLEAPRVDEHPHLFAVETWDETDDPVARVAAMAGPIARAAIGDQTWARFVLALQQALPSTQFVAAREVTASLRIVKAADEIDALRRAARAVDEIASAMRTEPFAGRREIDVHNELVERMLEAGHERANFAIVASAANAASPHHEPSVRVIDDGFMAGTRVRIT